MSIIFYWSKTEEEEGEYFFKDWRRKVWGEINKGRREQNQL